MYSDFFTSVLSQPEMISKALFWLFSFLFSGIGIYLFQRFDKYRWNFFLIISIFVSSVISLFIANLINVLYKDYFYLIYIFLYFFFSILINYTYLLKTKRIKQINFIDSLKMFFIYPFKSIVGFAFYFLLFMGMFLHCFMDDNSFIYLLIIYLLPIICSIVFILIECKKNQTDDP